VPPEVLTVKQLDTIVGTRVDLVIKVMILPPKLWWLAGRTNKIVLNLVIYRLSVSVGPDGLTECRTVGLD